MFKINDKELKEFEKDLKAFAHRALPFATKNTLNQSVFHAQKLNKRDVAVKMILKNRFTERSIQVDQARTLNIRRQAATVGSTADYMEDQEFGTTKTKRGRRGTPIPTGWSAGQENQQSRTRVPRRANKLLNIRLAHRRTKAKNRRQRNVMAIKQAATTGNKYVFLDLGRREGIFKVIGGKRRPRIKMVHDLSHDSVTIPRNPWHKPGVDATIVRLPEFYRKSLVFQLKRHNLFK